MKILFAVPQLPTNLNNVTGGVHSALINLLKGLSNFPVSIRVLSLNKNLKTTAQYQFSENITIYYEPEGLFSYHMLNYFFRGSSLLVKHCKQFVPDIIHFQEGNSFLFLKSFSTVRSPCLLTIHGNAINDSRYKSKISEKIKWRLNGYLENLLLPRNIIFLSEISAKSISLNKLKAYSIIPNAIDSRFFSLKINSHSNNRLIFIGVLNNRRNLLFLLKILKDLFTYGKKFTLDVFGGFENEHYKKNVLEFIEESALHHVVKLHGWVGQNVVAEYLQKSDIVVMTSLVETLPMVVAEAMAAGKVVVSSNVGGVPKMITDKKNGFIFSLSESKKLYEILFDLHDNHYLVNKISIEARKFANEMYQDHSVAAKTLLFYQRCLTIETAAN